MFVFGNRVLFASLVPAFLLLLSACNNDATVDCGSWTCAENQVCGTEEGSCLSAGDPGFIPVQDTGATDGDADASDGDGEPGTDGDVDTGTDRDTAEPPPGPQCGDGVIDEDEECDDRNTRAGDGCSSTCQVEDEWSCSGAPSLCRPDDPEPGECHIVARPGCRLADSGGPFESNLRVPPLSSIECNGSESESVGARIQSYSWAFVQQPAGSPAFLEPTDKSRTNFSVDQPGQYTLELEVEDANGCKSAPGQVTVTSSIDDFLYIELTWDAPTEANTELRLHLLHTEHGCWGDGKWDTHNGNWGPDWGVQGDPDDDPVLVARGYANNWPAVITFSQPEEGVLYAIGVQHRGSTLGWPAVSAPTKARIFVGGTLFFEAQATLQDEWDWWLVAGLQFPGPTLVPMDALYPQNSSGGYPACEW